MAIKLLPLKYKENQNHFYSPLAHRIMEDRNASLVCSDLSQVQAGEHRPLAWAHRWVDFQLEPGVRVSESWEASPLSSLHF